MHGSRQGRVHGENPAGPAAVVDGVGESDEGGVEIRCAALVRVFGCRKFVDQADAGDLYAAGAKVAPPRR